MAGSPRVAAARVFGKHGTEESHHSRTAIETRRTTRPKLRSAGSRRARRAPDWLWPSGCRREAGHPRWRSRAGKSNVMFDWPHASARTDHADGSQGAHRQRHPRQREDDCTTTLSPGCWRRGIPSQMLRGCSTPVKSAKAECATRLQRANDRTGGQQTRGVLKRKYGMNMWALPGDDT